MRTSALQPRARRVATLLVAFAGAWASRGCAAGGDASNGPTTAGATAGAASGGGDIFEPTGSTGTGGGDVTMNPCGSACGSVELCDDAHLGLDDNCDGQVDEACACQSGQAHACFKGDPSFRSAPGCYDGTARCTENGSWGPCLGGLHATDGCFGSDLLGCHPITAVPFQTVHLKSGTGNFSQDATGESWTVACPATVSSCPAVGGSAPGDEFKPLQSGEYTVTYSKTTASGEASCSYPLFVGARGLRVELEWEHDLGSTGVDLDLHVHKPADTTPWSILGAPEDCGFANCTVDRFTTADPALPNWFGNGATPPDPVDWYLDPAPDQNLCFSSPRGAGAAWQALGKGCHNPRLDLDNIECDPGETDSDDSAFCAPENVNIDYPPRGQWIRIGVHYFSNNGLGYAVHPVTKIFCDGALAAELGPGGFSPGRVTFAASQGDYDSDRLFWMVADVLFKPADACGTSSCVVQPLYLDTAALSPYFVTDSQAESGIGPPYPPVP